MKSKPLSLMTLLLDNRKDEMSPLVHTRMLYVRDHTRQDIEQILYFSRLGATHKDYFFEPLSILETCREAVEDNLTLLEEAGFSVEYTENDYQVISDKKGLMFILGQIISNSVKYAGNNPAPRLLFPLLIVRIVNRFLYLLKTTAQAYRCLTYPLFSTRGLLEIRAVTLVVLRVWDYTLFRKWQLTCLSRWS